MIAQRHDGSCIDRIDDTLQAKRGRRRAPADRVRIGRRLAWTIGALGFPAWAACHAVDIADAVARGVTGRTIIHRAAPYLSRLAKRGRIVADPQHDPAVRRPVRPGRSLNAAEA